MNGAGRLFIIAGCILLAAGLLISYGPKLPPWLGRLPGDISFRRGNISFYFPLATSLLLSAIASLIIWLFRK